MKDFALSSDDRRHLAKVIQDIEKTTSGEIRLVIAKRSAPIGPVVAELWLMLIILCLLTLLAFRIEWVLDFRWWWVGLCMVGSFPVAFLLSKWHRLERGLLTSGEMQQAVNQRAELEFYREGLGQTRGKTGVLLFLSLFEKRAIVLADKAINDKLKDDSWSKVVGMIVSSGRDGRWRDHLEEALRECGRLLSQHFPPSAGDRNELPNEIVIKD